MSETYSYRDSDTGNMVYITNSIIRRNIWGQKDL